MADLHFKRQNDGRVSLDSNVIEILNKHRQINKSAKEAGGVLLGRLIIGTDDVVVNSATEPGSRDRRGRTFFNRSKNQAQTVVDAEWHKSEGSIIYLGEWHTHPEDIPSPSFTDITNWLRISSEARYETDFLLFLIVGTSTIKIWELSKKDKPLAELCVCNTEKV